MALAPVAAALLWGAPALGQLGAIDDVLQGRSLAGQAVKGVAIAYAVRQSGKQLNTFINTVTLRNKMPQQMATRVVPVLSVGTRGYVGGAQVAGPKAYVDKVQAVWQYEQNFQRGEYRVKALVPSASLNPLQTKRVPRVGLAALIDVSLGGGFPGTTRSGPLTLGRVIRAGAVAGVVLAAARPINQFINTITFNKDSMTHVVPQVSVGETAYVGGAQVTGSAATSKAVKAVFEYWDAFDKGRYRVRILVPVNGIDPTRIRRVEGAGVVALIDTSIAEQKRAERPDARDGRWPVRVDGSRRIELPADPLRRVPVLVTPPQPRHDNGLHLGWTRGRHNGWDKDREEPERREEPKPRENRGRGRKG